MWADKKLCFLSFALKKILCHGMFTWNNDTCKYPRCVNIKTQSQFSLVLLTVAVTTGPLLPQCCPGHCVQSPGLTAPPSVSASVPASLIKKPKVREVVEPAPHHIGKEDSGLEVKYNSELDELDSKCVPAFYTLHWIFNYLKLSENGKSLIPIYLIGKNQTRVLF